MGNSLFRSRAVPGSNPAELTEHPMVRYNNVTAPTEGRYREIPERFGDSSHCNDIQLKTDPKRYNGAQHAGLEFDMTESMSERSGRPEGLKFGESERGATRHSETEPIQLHVLQGMIVNLSCSCHRLPN